MAAVTLLGWGACFWRPSYPARDPHHRPPPIHFSPGDELKGNKLECDFHLRQSPQEVSRYNLGFCLIPPVASGPSDHAPAASVVTDTPVGTQLG